MGVVYEALDRERDIRVALKTLRSVAPDKLLLFKNEFRALRDVQHPNLVSLGELIESEGQWFFTMELIEGQGFLRYVRGEARAAPTSSASIDGGDTAKLEVGIGGSAEQDLESTLGGGQTVDLPASGRSAVYYDDDRLRGALAGLARGLAALHRAGIVHRDVKPSNILVEDDGRVVLLDFGVVAELSQPEVPVEQRRVVGTVHYMAPEQARGESVGPAADWYAMGTLLFQALTGRLPFQGGSQQDVLARKATLHAPHPATIVPDLPDDLQDLCVALLERDPAERPEDDEILERLSISSTGEWLGVSPFARARGPAFVGRAAELAGLDDAFDASRGGAAVAVFIEGESGVGKSAMVEQFLQQQRIDDPSLVVLRGRCHERERVPYNAIDGVVDELSRYLRQRRESKVRRLVPERTGQLLQVFPALRAVDVLASAARNEVDDPATSDARAGAFAALRGLLTELAKRRATIVAIDDVQWADSDSLNLLEELMRPPGAPSLLLLATTRPVEGDGAPPAMDAIQGDVRHVRLAGLPRDEAEQLVRALFERFPEAADSDSAAIVDETGGHPMFIDELVRHAARTRRTGGSVRLDDALLDRVGSLADGARRLLEIVVTAGAPVPQAAVAAAADMDAQTYSAQLGVLSAANLIRIAGARHSDTIEPFHDRVRESVYRSLSVERRRSLHRTLARELEARGAGADMLFVHYDAAGQREQAARHTVAAAKAAAAALAFGRAVDLYQKALDDSDLTRERRRELLAALGYALQNDARAGEAADAFMQAAALADRDRTAAFDLRQRAAGLYMMGGQLQKGLSAAEAVLSEIGMRLPRGKISTLSSILWNTYRLKRHSLRWRLTKEDELAPEDRARTDVCWSMYCGLSMVEIFLGAYFGSRGTLLALRGGEPTRVSRALAASTVSAVAMGRQRQAKRLIEATRRATEQAGTEFARFYPQIAEAVYDFLLENDWSTALAGFKEAERIWKRAGRGPGWETDVTAHFLCSSLHFLGREPELEPRVREHARFARGTGNLLSEVSMRARFGWLAIVHDDPEAGEADLREAIASWTPRRETYGNQEMWALWSRTRIALYRGDVEAVWPDLEPEWKQLQRSLLSRMDVMKAEWVFWYASLLVALAVEANERGDAALSRKRAREAEHWTDRLARLPLVVSPAQARMLRAGLANLRGAHDECLRWLREAKPAVDAHAPIFSPILEYRIGQMIGGDEGAAIIASATDALRLRGYARPERLVPALPGWPHPG